MSKIPRDKLYTVGNPKRRYTSMVEALHALYTAPPRPKYVPIACLITCYIDAMAARGAMGTKPKFLRFLRNNFKQLCAGLNRQEPGMDGAEVFYKYYRSEMVHTFFSRKRKYAIAEDHELNGAYVGTVHVQGRKAPYIAVNIDRLYGDFVALAKRRAKQTRL